MVTPDPKDTNTTIRSEYGKIDMTFRGAGVVRGEEREGRLRVEAVVLGRDK